MGLLKKIKAKPSLQSVYCRRKVAEAKMKGDDEQLSSAQFIVTSNPKEYSDTSCPGYTSSTTNTYTNTDPISSDNKIDATSPPDCNENGGGGWSWLLSCLGSSFLVNSKAQTDDRTYKSTSSSSNEEGDDEDDSGDSSHSISRIDTVLNLGKPDDVSDITSAASIDDDSLSDSEDGDDE